MLLRARAGTVCSARVPLFSAIKKGAHRWEIRPESTSHERLCPCLAEARTTIDGASFE
jgi:hypothetical protein